MTYNSCKFYLLLLLLLYSITIGIIFIAHYIIIMRIIASVVGIHRGYYYTVVIYGLCSKFGPHVFILRSSEVVYKVRWNSPVYQL